MAPSWALHGPVLAMSLNTAGSPAVGCDRLPTVGGTVKLRAWAGLLGTASVLGLLQFAPVTPLTHLGRCVKGWDPTLKALGWSLWSPSEWWKMGPQTCLGWGRGTMGAEERRRDGLQGTR